MHFKKRQQLINQISNIISSLTPPLTKEEKKTILNKVTKPGIPISVFNANLSGLEILTKYLKEVENKSFKEISKILNRELSTLYNTYNNSKIKFKANLDISDDSIKIPLTIFRNRKYSILESLVAHLKGNQLSITKISSLLNRNYNTIKTVNHRYKLKNERA